MSQCPYSFVGEGGCLVAAANQVGIFGIGLIAARCFLLKMSKVRAALRALLGSVAMIKLDAA